MCCARSLASTGRRSRCETASRNPFFLRDTAPQCSVVPGKRVSGEINVKTTKINHLGIAVYDIETTRQVYEAMGLEVTKIIDVPEQKVRVAFIPVGESTIELVQPTTPDSTVYKYLEKRGPGLHHLALEVEDLPKSLSELQEHGSRLIDETPRQGAEGRIAFLHPKGTDGVLIELVEPDTDSVKGETV